ncbi:protein SPEC3-like [Neocloeon triangulifer]|uniref:protein SPEC3-like n=1 Tax=Neocloeon triangulifer TaxID=2078957 RepID=UPI00286EC6CA|nr:protein SPEC3-like [Neocloeon triangulifer]
MGTTVVEAPAPSDEKKKPSNLLHSAGVNFERRYRSNQTAQNYHVGQSEVVYEDADGHEHRMEIVKVSEKVGNFRKCVPRLSFVVACILCGLNLFLPGVGTLIATLRVVCGVQTSNPDRSQAICYGFLAAVLQMLLTPLIIGWVWSILYGVYLIQDAGGLPPEQPGAPSP